MTRTVIERRSILLFVSIFIITATIVSGIVAALLMEFDITMIGSLVILLILLSIALPLTRSKKEMIIIDEEGLTLNGNIMLGPIPWDCITGAKIFRIGLDKLMNVYLTNMSKLECVLGENIIHQKVNLNKKTGEMHISFDLDLCKLSGINLEAIIKAHAKG